MKFKITVRLMDDATVSRLQLQTAIQPVVAPPPISSPHSRSPTRIHSSPSTSSRIGQAQAKKDQPIYPLRMVVFHSIVSSTTNEISPVVWYTSTPGPLPQRSEKEIFIEWDDEDLHVALEKSLPFTNHVEGVQFHPLTLGRTVIPVKQKEKEPKNELESAESDSARPKSLVPKRRFFDVNYKPRSGDDIQLSYNIMNPFLHAIRVHIGMNISVSVPVSVPIITQPQRHTAVDGAGLLEEGEALERARRMSQRFGRKSFLTATAVLGIKPIVPPPPKFKIERQPLPKLQPPETPFNIDPTTFANSHDIITSMELNAETTCHILPKRFIIIAFTPDEILWPSTLMDTNGLSVQCLLIKFPSILHATKFGANVVDLNGMVNEIEAYYDSKRGWRVPENCLEPTQPEPTKKQSQRNAENGSRPTTGGRERLMSVDQSIETSTTGNQDQLKREMFQVIPAFQNLHEYLVAICNNDDIETKH